MFQQLPTAGLPWDIDNWDDIAHILEDLVTADVISEPTQARWDVRPAPRWGTIELRACDGASTLWEIGAIAAFSQCLIEQFQRKLDQGESLPRLQPWYVRENKWRAARYGLEADVIVNSDGRQVPLRDHLTQLIIELGPVAESLGCVAELADVSRILQHGNSSARQLAHYESHGTLTAVVDALSNEFQTSLN